MKNFAIVCLVLAACGSSDGGGGGDPVTPDASGGGDPLPTPDAPQPNVCSPSDPFSCSGETICIVDKCEAAFGRIYRFSGISVTVAPKNPGGSAWDSFGGAPDPQVKISLNDMEILSTNVASDTFQATYTTSADHEVIAGSKLLIAVTDSDVNAADAILNCKADPLTAQMLREHVVQCVGTGNIAGTSVHVNVDAK